MRTQGFRGQGWNTRARVEGGTLGVRDGRRGVGSRRSGVRDGGGGVEGQGSRGRGGERLGLGGGEGWGLVRGQKGWELQGLTGRGYEWHMLSLLRWGYC